MKRLFKPDVMSRSNEQDMGTDTHMHGSMLALGRVMLMVLVVCILAYFIASLPETFVTLHQPCTGEWCTNATGRLTASQMHSLLQADISLDAYAWSWLVFSGVTSLVWFGVAGILFWRKSDDWMVLLVALMLISVGVDNITNTLLYSSSFWRFAEFGMYLIVSQAILCTLALFPNGRFVPRWSFWVTLVYPTYVVCYLLFLGPQRVTGWALYYTPINAVTWFGSWTILTLAQLYRFFRVSTAVERQQTKWVVFSFFVVLLGGVVSASLGTYLSTQHNGLLYALGNFGYSVILLGLPLSIGIAILRYRLWDIDIILNRTLVYGSLTACIVGIYALLVGGMSTVLQTHGNFLISLVTAGVVAVIFHPLRERLQHTVNRLFYGQRDDPYSVISQLGSRLEATLAPERVIPTLVETIASALKFPYVALALPYKDDWIVAASRGNPTEELICLPLHYQTEQVGQLRLALRAPGEALASADQRLVQDLARQVGIAVHAVRLTTDLQRLAADLQRSRTQLVTAREEERRRLRGDLHDGLGSVLASLHLQAGAIRALLTQDPVTAEKLLEEQQRIIRAAIADIRRLVYALRPPSLDELGVVGALREQVTQYGLSKDALAEGEDLPGLQVTLEVPEQLPPLPAAIEVATYRIVQEALANVACHSRASSCWVCLSIAEGMLQVEVTDNGVGLPSEICAGGGLLAMRECAAELGGSCHVRAGPQGGTHVCVRLPVLVA